MSRKVDRCSPPDACDDNCLRVGCHDPRRDHPYKAGGVKRHGMVVRFDYLQVVVQLNGSDVGVRNMKAELGCDLLPGAVGT
jgi:hypothetical protein